MVSRQYLRLIEGRLLGAWWALRPGVGGAALGAPLRPCSGLRRGPRLRPAGPCSPLRGLRSGLGGMRPGPVVPPVGGPSGPLCAAPACAGVPCRRRGPPAGAFGRPLAVVVGGWFCPPAPPPVVWLSFRLAGAAGPPLGGLAWRSPWLGAAPCSPPGGGWGLSPRRRAVLHCWPLLLAPEDPEVRRRRTASRRSVSMSAMA